MKFLERACLWLILLGGFALRLFRLGADSLWYDETVSLFLARQDLAALTSHTAGDIHPPLYYYLLHFWGTLAGWSEFSAAFLSLGFGMLLLALTYRAGREWFSRPVALTAALLVAISPYNLWYSQEVRMYTLGALFGLASAYFFVKLQLEGHGTRRARDWVPYIVASALGMYTLYYFAFVLAFENVVALGWAIWKYRAHSTDAVARFLSWVGAQLGVVVLYAPWIPVAFRQAIDPPVPPWRSFASFGDVLVESFSALALGQSALPGTVWPVLVVVALLLLAGLFLSRARFRFLLLGYTFVPLLTIYLFSLYKPLYHVRYVFVYSPAFYLLLALGIAAVAAHLSESTGQRVGAAVTTTALLVLLTAPCAYSAYNFWFDPRYAADDLRGAVQRLADEWRPGDAILLDAGYTYTAFDYYFKLPVAWRGRLTGYTASPGDADRGAIVLQTGSIGGAPDLGWGNAESDFYATTPGDTRAALDRVLAAHPRVWLLRLYDTVVDPDGVVREYLAQHGRLFDDQGVTGESYARVQGYLAPSATMTALPANAVARPVTLGGRVLLKGFEPGAAELRAGAPLDVNLYWQANEPTNVDAHLFVGLYAADGTLCAGTEEIPLGNGLGTSRWAPGELLREPVRLLIPARTNPGNYILRVVLYNPLTNEPLAASTAEWVTEDNQIQLTAVTVRN